MNTTEMKQKLKTMYPKSENWARKVDKMKAAQVYAIYCKNFWADGKRKPVTRKRDQIPGQLDFMDILGGNL